MEAGGERVGVREREREMESEEAGEGGRGKGAGCGTSEQGRGKGEGSGGEVLSMVTEVSHPLLFGSGFRIPVLPPLSSHWVLARGMHRAADTMQNKNVA
eukprot:7342309-Pyramimonas_sp.AAC.1